jgi:hypothetical protein
LSRAKTRPRKPSPATATKSLERVREVALALPGVEEGTSYGTPGFRVRGKFFARIREDGDTLVVRCEIAERELLLEADPAIFHVTDHYRDWPYVLVRISKAPRAVLEEALESSWRSAAPRKLLAEHDGGAELKRATPASPRPARPSKRRSTRARPESRRG